MRRVSNRPTLLLFSIYDVLTICVILEYSLSESCEPKTPSFESGYVPFVFNVSLCKKLSKNLIKWILRTLRFGAKSGYILSKFSDKGNFYQKLIDSLLNTEQTSCKSFKNLSEQLPRKPVNASGQNRHTYKNKFKN